jgi:hypothetical protein
VIQDLAVGTDTACQITSTGGIFCWGLNSDIVSGVPAGIWVDIDMQTDFVCAMNGAFEPFCWGTNPPVINAPQPIWSMAVTSDAICGVRPSDRGVQCWGRDDFGQVSWPSANLQDSVLWLTGADDSICARKTDGSVTCWGELEEIGLAGPGGGSIDYPGSYFKPSSGTTYHCFDLDGNWACWGLNSQIGILAPTFSDGIAFGAEHVCALVDGPECAGAGGPTDPNGTAPHYGQSDPILDSYDAILAGPYVTCGLNRFFETVGCWGLGTSNDGNPLTTYMEWPDFTQQ